MPPLPPIGFSAPLSSHRAQATAHFPSSWEGQSTTAFVNTSHGGVSTLTTSRGETFTVHTSLPSGHSVRVQFLPGGRVALKGVAVVTREALLDTAGQQRHVQVRVLGTEGGSGVLVSGSLIRLQGGGFLRLTAPLEIPLGTRLSLSWEERGGVQRPPLQEFLRAVFALPSVLRGPLPQIRSSFGASTLLLLSAIRGSQASLWAGKGLSETMERDMTRRLSKLSTSVKDTAGRSWLGVMLPLMDERAHHVLSVFFPDEGHEKERRETPSNTQRFVLGLNLSQLGPVQLDCLCDRSQVSLVVRTHHPLPPSLQETLRQRFPSLMKVLHVKGKIMFHVVSSFPLDTPQPLPVHVDA